MKTVVEIFDIMPKVAVVEQAAIMVKVGWAGMPGEYGE